VSLDDLWINRRKSGINKQSAFESLPERNR
jgi:hypothetical protein